MVGEIDQSPAPAPAAHPGSPGHRMEPGAGCRQLGSAPARRPWATADGWRGHRETGACRCVLSVNGQRHRGGFGLCRSPFLAGAAAFLAAGWHFGRRSCLPWCWFWLQAKQRLSCGGRAAVFFTAAAVVAPSPSAAAGWPCPTRALVRPDGHFTGGFDRLAGQGRGDVEQPASMAVWRRCPSGVGGNGLKLLCQRAPPLHRVHHPGGRTRPSRCRHRLWRNLGSRSGCWHRVRCGREKVRRWRRSRR